MTDPAASIHQGLAAAEKAVAQFSRGVQQARVLELMTQHRTEWGKWPSYAEVGSRMGISKWTVRDHVRALRGKGLLPHETCGLQNNGDKPIL